MARLRTPTQSNVNASIDIRRQLLERIAELVAAETALLEEVPNSEPDSYLDLLSAAVAADRDIEAALLELAAAITLAGVSAHTVSKESGIGTATLTRKCRGHLAEMRGREVEPDPDAPYGWRVVAT